jgi:flagellar hook-length control protein FliK
MEPGQGKGDVPGAPVVRESAPAPAPAIAQAVSNSADPIVAIAAPAAGHGPLLSGPHAAAAPARTDSSMPAREVPDLPQQLVRAAHLQWRDGVGEARLRLNPEHLGEVTISLRVEQGAVLASVKAESASTLQLIQLRQQELQSGLETRGLHLDHLVLMTNADERRQRREYQPPRSPRPNRRNRDEDSPRFEVLA